jgi:tetratricopeptide (TPR) repeat protein
MLEAPPMAAPTSPADAIAKAQRLRALDFYEDAVRVLRDSDARFGPRADVRLETAWNLLMIGEEDVTRDAAQAKIDAEVAVARKAFDEALRMDPHVAGQDLLQAKLLRYERANVQARALLKTIVERTPNDPAAHREYADFAFTTQDWTTAEREYSALARLTPKDGWPVLYATISKQWLERPAAELEAGYLAAARLIPEEPMAIARLAGLYENNPAKNVALLERFVAEVPEAVEARLALARLLLASPTPDRERAERVVRDAVKAGPRSRAAHGELARLLESSGRLADAVREDLEALALSDKGAVTETSDALDRILRDARASDAVPADLRLRAWDAVIARNPASGRYAHDAGVWFLEVGHDAATAARYLEAAVKAEPGSSAYRADLDHARGGAVEPPK